MRGARPLDCRPAPTCCSPGMWVSQDLQLQLFKKISPSLIVLGQSPESRCEQGLAPLESLGASLPDFVQLLGAASNPWPSPPSFWPHSSIPCLCLLIHVVVWGGEEKGGERESFHVDYCKGTS